MSISSISDYDIIYAYHQTRSMQAKNFVLNGRSFLFHKALTVYQSEDGENLNFSLKSTESNSKNNEYKKECSL